MQTTDTFIKTTNICPFILVMHIIFSCVINWGNVANWNIEKYKLVLFIFLTLIYIIQEILLFVRIYILLKNDKAVNKRKNALILDIIFLVLNTVWIKT